MGVSRFTYTKENVSVDDMQKIINEFPNEWFLLGEGKNRNEKPIRQWWGWSTVIDINNPWHDWKDDDHGLGVVGVLPIGGFYSNLSLINKIGDFIDTKLREYGYTVLKVYVSY